MNTRTRILHAAEQLFVERGYHPTTLREVAERVGITKPALYYHFESKSEILASLLEPMTTELEQVLANAVAASGSGGTTAMRTVLLTGWLDVFLRSRGALLALFRDLAAMPSTLYERLLAVLERAVETGAGPDAKDADRIAMAQAISAITDPVALIPNVPAEVLREHLLAGVWRLIGEPAPVGINHTHHTPQPANNHRAAPPPASAPAAGPPPASAPAPAGTLHGHTHPATGRGRGGRPKALSPADADRVRELHASGKHTAESIAAQLGVSRATVYRYLKTQF